jgi:hypothetical protein
MIARKPLTTDPFSFLSIATFVLLAYALLFIENSCPGQQTLANFLRTFSAGSG